MRVRPAAARDAGAHGRPGLPLQSSPRHSADDRGSPQWADSTLAANLTREPSRPAIRHRTYQVGLVRCLSSRRCLRWRDRIQAIVAILVLVGVGIAALSCTHDSDRSPATQTPPIADKGRFRPGWDAAVVDARAAAHAPRVLRTPPSTGQLSESGSMHASHPTTTPSSCFR